MTDEHSKRIARLSDACTIELTASGNMLALSNQQLYRLQQLMAEFERLQKSFIKSQPAP